MFCHITEAAACWPILKFFSIVFLSINVYSVVGYLILKPLLYEQWFM